jgi:hypothetical protein
MEIVALIAIFVGLFFGTALGVLFVINDRRFVCDTIAEVKEYIKAKSDGRGSGMADERDAKIWKTAYLTGCNDILDFFRYGDKKK